MIPSEWKDHDAGKWKTTVNKRIKRLETIFCIQAVFLIAALFPFPRWKSTYQKPSLRVSPNVDTGYVSYKTSSKETITFSDKLTRKNKVKQSQPEPLSLVASYESYRAKNKKKKQQFPPSTFSSYESIDRTSSKINRIDSRQLIGPERLIPWKPEAQNTFCSGLPILSPITDMSNFTMDERVHNILHVIHGLSSTEALDNDTSPQYKAACWILYDDELQISPGNDLMIQRYVAAVLIYTTRDNVNAPLPMDTCDHPILRCNDEGQITSIKTRGGTHAGTLPKEIAHLRHLETLDVSNNELSGTIPKELGSLENLQELLLANNNLTGSIPPELSKARNLISIEFAQNNLHGSIPSEVGKMKHLTALDFQQNNMTGPIPVELFDCTQLQHLLLAENNFTGPIPTEIHRLEQLQNLLLNSNKYSGTIPSSIGRLSSMRDLWLFSNNFTGPFPEEIGNLTALESLWVNNNKLTGKLPDIFGKLKNLTELFMSTNEFTGGFPESFWNLGSSSVDALNIEGNKIKGTIPDSFCHEKSLVVVDNSRWFVDKPGVSCDCCDSARCHLWRTDSLNAPKRKNSNSKRRPPPPRRKRRTERTEHGKSLDSRKLFIEKSGHGPPVRITQIVSSEVNETRSEEGSKPPPRDGQSRSPPEQGGQNIPPRGEGISQPSGGDQNVFERDEGDAMSIEEGQRQPPPENRNPDDGEDGTFSPQSTKPISNKSDQEINEDKKEDQKDIKVKDRPDCPKVNVQTFKFSMNLEIYDHVANVTFFENANDDIGGTDICMSPSGCYTVSFENRQSNEISRRFGYSSTSKSLIEQNQCDAVEICGTFFDENHPRRKGLNHLTQTVVSDLSILDDPELPQYKALCWIMTEDTLFDDFDICDGTFLQRYLLAVHSYSYKIPLDDYHKKTTCEWEGIQCDETNKFVTEMDLSNRGLNGKMLPEIGLLTRLEKIDLSNNNLTGEYPSGLFKNTPFLKVFDISFNKIEGRLPKKVFEAKQIHYIDISNNLFTDGIPSDMKCSDTLEYIDLSNNLLGEEIEGDALDCKELKHLDLSKNNFQGSIPPNIGNLEKLQVLKLNENRLDQTIPSEVFQLSQLEILMLQANDFTGSIPTEIGNLQNVKNIQMNHNSLQGVIPSEIEKLEMIEVLHMHRNFLTGVSPDLSRSDGTVSYITDCGLPNYLLTTPLKCESCTMCCNSKFECQENIELEFPVQSLAFMVVFLVPTGILVIGFISSKIVSFAVKKAWKRSISTIYQNDSVYCLVFSNNLIAWIIAFCTIITQGGILYVFLQASSVESNTSDWRFSWVCLYNRSECIDGNSIDKPGETLFSLVMITYLGVDFIQAVLQLYGAARYKDFRLLISGLGIFALTSLAMFTTIVYNWALAESNTDLIVNAVILLFVNDMDEKLLDVMTILYPSWVDDRFDEINENMLKKDQEYGIASHNMDDDDDDNDDSLQITASNRTLIFPRGSVIIGRRRSSVFGRLNSQHLIAIDQGDGHDLKIPQKMNSQPMIGNNQNRDHALQIHKKASAYF